METRTLIQMLLLCISLALNILAIVALYRSKHLSYNIRIFSVNLAITDIVTSVMAGMFLVIYGELIFETTREDCFQAAFGIYSIVYLYLTSSFTVTAMGIDRFVSIAYPYKYLDIISNKKGRIIGVCVMLWVIALVVIVSHDIVNNSRMFHCMIGSEIGEQFHIGFQNSNIRLIGLTNLCILITNMATYMAILTKIFKQSSEVRNREKSTLGKILAFAVTYALLHGPFNITTVLVGVFNDGLAPSSAAVKVLMTITLLGIIVDPILYAWRYMDCRIQMLMLLCHCNRSYMDKLQQKRNEFYGSYVINVADVRNTELHI